MIWSWGDGTTNYSWFPAQHTYPANGTYSVVVTAISDVGETFARNQSLSISTVEPRCRDSLSIYPPFVVLRGGKTNEMLTIDLRGPEGERVAWRPAEATFESSNPELVQVTQDGDGDRSRSWARRDSCLAQVSPSTSGGSRYCR